MQPRPNSSAPTRVVSSKLLSFFRVSSELHRPINQRVASMPLTASNTSAAGAAARNAGQAAGPSSLEDQLTIEMLGAGNEVGRSCCVLKYKGEFYDS